MRYRQPGKTGLNVSEIGFGAWAIGESGWGRQSESDSIAALNRALDLGVNLLIRPRNTETVKVNASLQKHSGERLRKTVEHVNDLKTDIEPTGWDLPALALKFPLMHPAVGTVIPGMRKEWQAEANTYVSDLGDPDDSVMEICRKHAWRRGVWYSK